MQIIYMDSYTFELIHLQNKTESGRVPNSKICQDGCNMMTENFL